MNPNAVKIVVRARGRKLCARIMWLPIAREATSVGQDQVSLKLDSTKPKCHSYSVQHPYLRMDTLRNQFVDNETWVSLARRFYVRLPNWRTEPTNENMRRWLRRFRVTETQYMEATGYKSLEDFRTYNPDWPLRAWLGLLLEYVAERDEAKGVLRAYNRP